MRRLLPLCAILLFGSGCVDRFLSIRTDPPGATVYVDGKKVTKIVDGKEQAAETPCELKFVWYGGREIVLEKEGYLSQTHVESVNAPWYQYPVLDFVTDVLIVFKITDRREFFYRLEKLEVDAASLEEAKKRAEELRRKAKETPK